MNAPRPSLVVIHGLGVEKPPANEVAASRAQAMQRIGPEELLVFQGKELAIVQAVLGHGSEYGRWITPRRWCPASSNTMLNLDLRERLINQIPDQSICSELRTGFGQQVLDLALETLTRYLIVLRMGPAGLGRKREAQPLDPSSIAFNAYYISSKLIAFALMRWLQSHDEISIASGEFLQIVCLDDIASCSESQKMQLLAEVNRMHKLFDLGWWTDLPCSNVERLITTDVAGDVLPTSKERKRDSHLPLPDIYVSEMGEKSLWLIESLAPNLLQLAENISTIWQDSEVNVVLPRAVQNRRRADIAKLLDSWIWKDANGNPINQPPFPMVLSRTGKKKTMVNDGAHEKLESMDWPPRTFASVLELLSNVQRAHLFVVLLSTGGRKSEIVSLRRNCVEYARDGRPYANGRTFKLVRRHDGEMRDWALPDLAVIALEQQTRLVQIVERIGLQLPLQTDRRILNDATPSDHLWVQISSSPASDRTQQLIHLDKAIQAYAKSLCMDIRPGDQMLRLHRFRKTVARLVALAIAQAPKVLMGVFGHKSIEMTLYYILSDKSLQAEIEQVSRELRVMRAEEVVSTIVEAEEASVENRSLGEYGGPAALMVNRAIHQQKERVHRSGRDWEAGDARELAEILTLQGKAWEVVRHGVICTKLPYTEAGPCNKSRGRPEPSKCQTNCNHRLEEAFLREDVDSSIAYCVESFEAESKAQNELMLSFWAGQIRANVIRFSDLLEKWSVHPIVKKILNGQIA